MFIKNPDDRIPISEIVLHDWVTNNGASPLSLVTYPKLELTKKDTQNLFTSVFMISRIKMKLKNQLNLQREKKRRESYITTMPKFFFK